MIFQGVELSPAQVAHIIRNAYDGCRNSSKERATRLLREPVINYDQARGFFDGAFRGSPGLCGVGVLLCLYQSHHFNLKLAVGQGTKNRAELFTLWLLKNAAKKGFKEITSICRLQVNGGPGKQ